MDRFDAMKVFVTALDEGSLAGAGRKLGRSPAAVSRAVAFLEDHVGVPLLHRTTRSSKLSEDGERYAATCRRVLIDLHEAEILVASKQSAPGGTLTLTAPVAGGEDVLRPILDDFLDAFPTVSGKLVLIDQPVNLIDEGIDAALRIGHLSRTRRWSQSGSARSAGRLSSPRRPTSPSIRRSDRQAISRHQVISRSLTAT